MFMGTGSQQSTNLGDLIMQKIKEKETQIVAESTDPRTCLFPRLFLLLSPCCVG